MPERVNTRPGAPCWVDLASSDLVRSFDFYAEVFDWEPVAGEDELAGGFVTFYLDGKKVAGAVRRGTNALAAGSGPDTWTSYLLTTDAAATAAAVKTAGGTIVAGPEAIAVKGTLGLALDPGGATVGFWQPEGHPGFELYAQHATVVWQEVMTRDFAASVAFYESVFGWSTELMGDTDSFRYTRFMADGVPQAGIMDATRYLPADASARWQVYFGVEDVDETVRRVRRQGGHVVSAAENTPYGRNAGVTDSTGAYFLLSSSIS